MKPVHYKRPLQNAILATVLLLVTGLALCSCQKEMATDGGGSGGSTGGGGTTNQKPKIGTRWSYRYYTYYGFAGGGLASSAVLNVQAKSQVVLGGDQWLNLVDTSPDTTVFLFNEKTDGLHDYTNNNAYLFCKSPATVNDTYTSYLGGTETFVVKSTSDSAVIGISGAAVTVPVIYYEGSSGGNVLGKIWYNEYAWIIKIETYKVNPFSGYYYRYSTLALDNIVY